MMRIQDAPLSASTEARTLGFRIKRLSFIPVDHVTFDLFGVRAIVRLLTPI